MRAGNVGGETALVTNVRIVKALLEGGFQGMKHFRTHAHRIRHAGGRHRHDHEFLKIDGVVSMGAAVEDVHHRHRHHMRVRPAEIGIKRHTQRGRRRLRHRQRHPENGIGAQPPLVPGAVKLDHRPVNGDLIPRIHAAQPLGDLAIDSRHCLGDALAMITIGIIIAQLDGLMRAGGGAGGHGGAPPASVLENDIDFNGGIAAAVENFAAMDADDAGHGLSS